MKPKRPALLICLLAAACARESSPPPAQAIAPVDPAAAVASKLDGTAPAPIREARTQVVGDALLSVSAPEFPGCQPAYGTVVATVRWDASSLTAGRVAIFVESPGNPRKLWAEGEARGESVTGPWVFDRTQFTLIEKGSGRELAQRTVVATPCK
jgi:hypothetical protein